MNMEYAWMLTIGPRLECFMRCDPFRPMLRISHRPDRIYRSSERPEGLQEFDRVVTGPWYYSVLLGGLPYSWEAAWHTLNNFVYLSTYAPI